MEKREIRPVSELLRLKTHTINLKFSRENKLRETMRFRLVCQCPLSTTVPVRFLFTWVTVLIDSVLRSIFTRICLQTADIRIARLYYNITSRVRRDNTLRNTTAKRPIRKRRRRV